ncbi:MAG TPA: hypothetical protein VKE69_09975 [Planctomycetota bacterium]|nr:hypothetical protein [Planctomycetota bacterium]
MTEPPEQRTLRHAFVAGAVLLAVPIAYGAIYGYPRELVVFALPALAGLVVLVHALENSVRSLRERIRELERRSRERPEDETTPPPNEPGPHR